MLQKVVIIGSGGFGREVLDIFEACNKVRNLWDVLGFIDDNPQTHGKKIWNYCVLGGIEWFKKPEAKGVQAIIAIGDNYARKSVSEKLVKHNVEFCNIIHPSVIMTPYVTLGKGVVITASCILTNNIQIGNHVHLNLDCTIGHDAVLGDFVNLAPGVHISGNNELKEGVYCGTGVVTIQHITIGSWSTVGAGAVVVKNLPENVVAMGVPARITKELK